MDNKISSHAVRFVARITTTFPERATVEREFASQQSADAWVDQFINSVIRSEVSAVTAGGAKGGAR